ncbi:MAG: hypothetical protein AAF730_00210 [Bacteroidota bacterium]
MMRRLWSYRLWSIGVLLLCCALPAVAQRSDFTVERWNGGALRSDVRLGLNLSGGGPQAGTMGGLHRTLDSRGLAGLYTNPALLGRTASGFATVDLHGRVTSRLLGLSLGDLIGDSTLTDATDQLLDDLDYADDQSRFYTDEERLDAEVRGRVPAFGLALSLGDGLAVGVGFHQPAAIDVAVAGGGFETLLAGANTAADDPFSIDVLAGLNADAAFSLTLDVLTGALGWARTGRDGSQWGLGAGVSHYRLDHRLRAEALVQGTLLINGVTPFAYNDPNDARLDADETNRLFLRMGTEARTTAWGGHVGAFYIGPEARFALSAAYTHRPSFTLTDPDAFAESYLPMFVDLDGTLDPDEAAGETELFDVERVDIARPSLTTRTADSLGQHVTFEQPHALTLGVDVRSGRHLFSLNVAPYFGDLVYALDYSGPRRLGKAMSTAIRLGIDIGLADDLYDQPLATLPLRLLFLDLDGWLFQLMRDDTGYSNPRYRLTAGGALGASIDDGFGFSAAFLDGLTPTALILSRQYTLYDRLDVGVVVLGYPDVAFRIALGVVL